MVSHFGKSVAWLDRPFSKDKVRATVFLLNKEKALGPNGFTITMYQECWDVIKEDLLRVFSKFHINGIINQGTNVTFIVLAPKKKVKHLNFQISDLLA